MIQSDTTPTPLEKEVATTSRRRTLSIGLPRCADPSERRFPITPEGAQLLTDQGFTLVMEERAGASIHYTDAQYARSGVVTATRADALACDIVLSMAPLEVPDLRRMRRGAMLMTLLGSGRLSKDAIAELLRRNIVTLALDLMEDSDGCTPFADILDEIDGRAAMARASSLLADPDHGKGILLGGVAGVVPCEVTVIGSGLAACSAARSAAGLGAIVRMLDYDVYRLRAACRDLGPAVVGATLHPRALISALRTADVIVNTAVSPAIVFDADAVAAMKKGVVIFDLSTPDGKAFPTLPHVDLASSSPVDIDAEKPSRVCYVNAGSLVPRTAAMALSDAFITMMRSIHSCEGLTNALKLLPGLQRAALTFMGRAVNADVAAAAGTRHVDINLYLTLS